MSSFWKNARIMAIAEVFLRLKALIMMPLITKYLGAVNYGLWSQVSIMVSMATPLVYLGMDNSLSRFLPGLPLEQQKKDFTGWLLFGTATSIALCLLISLMHNPLAKVFFGKETIAPTLIVLASLNVATTSLLTGIRMWFRVQQKAWSLISMTLLQNILQLCLVIHVLIRQQGVQDLIFQTLLADSALLVAYTFYLFYKKILIKPSFNWLPSYFRFGIVLLPSSYAVWILNNVDRVFLAHYQSLAEVGIYSVCFMIAYSFIQTIINPVWSLFFTKASELYNQNRKEALEKLFNESITFILWITLPAIFGLLAIGNTILVCLTTPEFFGGGMATAMILTGYFFSMLSSHFEAILALKKKTYLSSYFTITTCALNMVLNFTLIPAFSYHGAAAAIMISFSGQLLLSFFYAKKEHLVKIETKALPKIIGASGIMYFTVLFLQTVLKHPEAFFSIALSVVTGVIVYGLLSYAFRIHEHQKIHKNAL